MMVPEQEALLASPEGRLRYARGVAKGIEDFLREMAN
jgi:N-acetylmuramoyl-L-alanine amidase